jgi:Arc/MetJ-type ribon-helix-helix transcriptional regulator
MTLAILGKRTNPQVAPPAPQKLEKFQARTSFLFSLLASQQLEKLKHRTRLSSYTDVLAAALSVLSGTIQFVVAGGHIYFKSKKSNKLWAYSPYTPPRDYPHFAPSWGVADDNGAKERHSFSFDATMLEQVEAIRAASRFQSLSDVVRAAIAVLNELLSVQEAGDQIIFRDKNGSARPYVLFSDDKAKRGSGDGGKSKKSATVVSFGDAALSKSRPPATAKAATRRTRTTRGSG